MAAGLSLKPENYEKFTREFQKLTVRLMNGVPTAEPRKIDLSVSEYDCSEALCHQLDMLEPYGEGFPPPLLGMTAAPTEATYMGASQTHLKYNLPSGVSAVLWNEAEWQRERERRGKGLPKKFVGVPTLNAFRGNVSVQFIAEYAN